MESNTTKVSEDPSDIRETKKNCDVASGNVMSNKVGEDKLLDSRNDIKALSQDKTPKPILNKRRASVSLEMQNDKENQKASVTENDDSENQSTQVSGFKPPEKGEEKIGIEAEAESVNIKDSDKTYVQKPTRNGKSNENLMA